MEENKPSTNEESEVYEFGPFCLDPNKAQLVKDGEPVPLVRKAFETLQLLVKNRGQVIEKDFLIKQLWPDSFVEEGNLTQYIYLLRKILNGNAEAYIETLHKHGYRFVADVRVISKEGAAPQQATSLHESGLEIFVPTLPQHPQANGSTTLTSDRSIFTSLPQPRLWMAASALIILSLTVYIYFRQRNSAVNVGSDAAIHSLAVLPFKQVGSANDHLGLGMADALITRMGKLQLFPVRPTSAVLGFEEKKIDSTEAGRQLGVDTVLDGTIQREGEMLRVTVQLINVRNGNQIWADKFEEKFTNVFDVQDAISEKMARSLRLQLSSEKESSLKKRYTTNTEAYQAYVTGYYLWSKRTEKDLFKAVENFQRAITLDPNYALAHAGLADAYIMISFYHYGPMQEYSEKARNAVTRALEIDPTISEAYVTLAEVQRANIDNVAAAQSFRKAIELNPYNATAHMRYGWALASDLNIVEAEREMRLAQEYDPLSIVNNVALGEMLVFRRNDKEATKYLERALDLNPDTCFARITLATIYSRQGRHDDALRLIERETQQAPLLETAAKALVYAKAGRKNEALKLARTLRNNPAITRDGSATLGLTYFVLGEKEEAFHWIEVSLRNKEEAPVVLAFDPDFDEAKADPRYEEIVQRVRAGNALR